MMPINVPECPFFFFHCYLPNWGKEGPPGQGVLCNQAGVMCSNCFETHYSEQSHYTLVTIFPEHCHC